jgi:hypothetical protein
MAARIPCGDARLHATVDRRQVDSVSSEPIERALTAPRATTRATIASREPSHRRAHS